MKSLLKSNFIFLLLGKYKVETKVNNNYFFNVFTKEEMVRFMMKEVNRLNKIKLLIM